MTQDTRLGEGAGTETKTGQTATTSATTGTSGASGTTDTSGLSGTTGTSSTSGTAGTIGTSGTSGTSGSSGFIGSSSNNSSDAYLAEGSSNRSTYRTSNFYQDESETGYRSSGRAIVVRREPGTRPGRSTVIAAVTLGAVAAGVIPFLFSRGSSVSKRKENALVTESVTINRPARELYNFWREFTNLPQFMDNIKSVEKLDERRSRWTIKAPAGTSVEFVSRVVDDVPGRVISWESEEGASVPNRGRVEFIDNGGSTTVRTTISYDPPAGAAGRVIAKLFMREPQVQAREDLNRLKALMER